MSHFLTRLRQAKARQAAIHAALRGATVPFRPAKAATIELPLCAAVATASFAPPRRCPCGELAAMWLTDIPVTRRDADGVIVRALGDFCSRECREGRT